MTIGEIRQSFTPEKIIQILSKYEVSPVTETDSYIVFPTCCHNINGGSPKLYYYKNNYLFRCYTECNSSFDIFELIIKMEKLRGNEINLPQAISITGANPKDASENDNSKFQRTIDYMYQFAKTVYNVPHLEPIDEEVLNASIFNTDILAIWEQEGISLATMQKYKIGYDPVANCITIPIYDNQGQLVSVRGRFLAQEEQVKYKPITFFNKILAAPSSQMLYGLWQNKQAIQNTKTAIIFESEKSVLMMDTYYGNRNNSVATFGKNISNQHILMLRQIGAENIILAYDADYRTDAETITKLKEYRKIAKNLTPFFTVSIVMDWDRKLGYKDSPIDCGKQIFEELLENRCYVKL